MNPLISRLELDFRSNEPLYLQLVRQIETLVRQGELPIGAQLPTVRELAAELRINFNTVARAYKLLDEARLISTQRGRGTYVWEPPSQAEPVATAVGLRELARQYLEAAARLGAPPSSALAVLTELVGGPSEKE